MDASDLLFANQRRQLVVPVAIHAHEMRLERRDHQLPRHLGHAHRRHRALDPLGGVLICRLRQHSAAPEQGKREAGYEAGRNELSSEHSLTS